MSIVLTADPKTTPGITIKTTDISESLCGIVGLRCLKGNLDIGYRDFLEMVRYVLTNTDLQPNDPRFALVVAINRIQFAPGCNGTAKMRLVVPELEFEDPKNAGSTHCPYCNVPLESARCPLCMDLFGAV